MFLLLIPGTWLYSYLRVFDLQPTAVEDPETLVALFKEAAINAKEAGFDDVEGSSYHRPLSWYYSTYR